MFDDHISRILTGRMDFISYGIFHGRRYEFLKELDLPRDDYVEVRDMLTGELKYAPSGCFNETMNRITCSYDNPFKPNL